MAQAQSRDVDNPEYAEYIRYNAPKFNYYESIEENALRSYKYHTKYYPERKKRGHNNNTYVKHMFKKMAPFQEAERRGVRPPYTKRFALTYRDDNNPNFNINFMKPHTPVHKKMYTNWKEAHRRREHTFNQAKARETRRMNINRVQINPIHTKRERLLRSKILRFLHQNKQFKKYHLKMNTHDLNQAYIILKDLV